MKIIAMYLPQFHRVKENDDWWGEGYTEWFAVREAIPYFERQIQPRIPLNNNYYDLLKKGTMQWQSDLMREYGIDGVCIYHYWFADGRNILEKPAENLLHWKDIDMPYCFCWANETWARTWSKIGGTNAWNSNLEIKNKNGDEKDDDGILIEQRYGDKEEWEQHFDYLCPFFCDDRYIKIDGKPVFLVYRAKDIHCFSEMIAYWRDLAKDTPFKDVYFIACDADKEQYKDVDALVISEPNDASAKVKKYRWYGDHDQLYPYRNEWGNILLDCRQSEEKPKVYYQGMTGVDTTPRKGKKGSIAVEYATPEKFEYYLKKILKKSLHDGNEFVFLNAWNEWGEGMYLEPDEKYGYGYLKAIKKARMEFENEKLIDDEYVLFLENEVRNAREYLERAEKNAFFFSKWLGLKMKGCSISDYLFQIGAKRIAVYGMGLLGKALCEEVRKNNKLSLEYAIDSTIKESGEYDVPLYASSCKVIPDCDIIVVAVTYDVDKIKQMIKKKSKTKIISIAELLSCIEETHD